RSTTNRKNRDRRSLRAKPGLSRIRPSCLRTSDSTAGIGSRITPFFNPAEWDYVLFRQASFLAQSLQPRIAAQRSKFRPGEVPADPNRACGNGAIQSFKGAVVIAQASEDPRLSNRVSLRQKGCNFLGLFAAAGTRVRVGKLAGEGRPLFESCF